MARYKKSSRPESVKGAYCPIPWSVIDSESFIGASDKARALLFALMRQHNGKNNGHLHLTKSWMATKGYKCPENNNKARDELIHRGLLVQTRRGGLNYGPNKYALTWLDITNYSGLDICSRNYRKGAYLLCSLPPTPRRRQPKKKKAVQLTN